MQDFYIERINPGDPKEHQTPDGFTKFDVRDAVIKVKGEDDVRRAMGSTRRGPILSDALEDARTTMSAGYVLALRRSALKPQDHTLRAIRRINRA